MRGRPNHGLCRHRSPQEGGTRYFEQRSGRSGVVPPYRSATLQKLHDYLHSHLQPWFKADVHAILDEPDVAAVREGRYVGMHIRRGDKKIEATRVRTQVRECLPCWLSLTMVWLSVANGTAGGANT